MLPSSNPFSTRFTRPGAIPPLDVEGGAVSVATLLPRLRQLGGVAVIVGPHGSGKSTLLTRLAEAIDAMPGTAISLRLRNSRDLHRAVTTLLAAHAGDVILLDGWETLGRCGRAVVRGLVRLRGCGLVVTAHDATGLPVLMRCRTSVELLRAIVDRLPGRREWYGRMILPADVVDAFARHGGDIREALFALYDRYELRRLRAEADGDDDHDGGADRTVTAAEIQEIGGGFFCPGAPGRNLR